ncbi:unnamed protein product [Camellia sinensis]
MKYNQVTLNCGSTIPIMALGTYSSQNDREETKHAVQTALKMGYRHFDTAKIYGSEAAVGEALNQTVEREDIFLTSKPWGSDHRDPVSGVTRTLKRLGMEHVDMYLVHWPVKLKPWATNAVPEEAEFEPVLDLETTWGGMKRCLDMGLCRSIGVSKFSTNKIQRLLDFASNPPAVNQVSAQSIKANLHNPNEVGTAKGAQSFARTRSKISEKPIKNNQKKRAEMIFLSWFIFIVFGLVKRREIL